MGRTGKKYNIGGENEWQNISLLYKVIELTCTELGWTRKVTFEEGLKHTVQDHD